MTKLKLSKRTTRTLSLAGESTGSTAHIRLIAIGKLFPSEPDQGQETPDHLLNSVRIGCGETPDHNKQLRYYSRLIGSLDLDASFRANSYAKPTAGIHLISTPLENEKMVGDIKESWGQAGLIPSAVNIAVGSHLDFKK